MYFLFLFSKRKKKMIGQLFIQQNESEVSSEMLLVSESGAYAWLILGRCRARGLPPRKLITFDQFVNGIMVILVNFSWFRYFLPSFVSIYFTLAFWGSALHPLHPLHMCLLYNVLWIYTLGWGEIVSHHSGTDITWKQCLSLLASIGFSWLHAHGLVRIHG